MSDVKSPVRFGDFVLDPERAELRRLAGTVAVQPQVFDGLRFFLAHPGVLHTREALHEALWPGVFVADDALSQLIRKIRVALDDDPKEPRYLVTVPRRGYRFVAEVEPYHEQAPASFVAPVAVAPAPVSTGPEQELFGRERALEEVLTPLARGPWVTIAGTGGMGKSHLARAARASLRARGEDPVLVDLQDVSGAEGLMHALARELQVPLLGAEAAAHEAQIGHALEGRGALVVLLDDLDGLHEVAPELVQRWHGQAPEVRWLFTSRRPLNLPGEQVVELGPLPAEAARALFHARALAAGTRPEAEEGVLDALLDRLDRSPLAIELAAARTRVLGIAELGERLEDRFRLLRDRRGHAHERHRSLHACLLTSWERLPDGLRRCLGVLSVLPGAFHAATAEALLEAVDDPEIEPLEALEDLRDHALLHRETGRDGEACLKVLESLRALVREMDEVADARAQGVAVRVRALVGRARVLQRTQPAGAELDRVVNLLIALLDGLEAPLELVEALDVLAPLLRERGPLDLGFRAAERVERAAAQLPAEVCARWLLARLELLPLGRPLPPDLVEQARAAAQQAGRDDLDLGVELIDLSARMRAGAVGPLEVPARRCLERALAGRDLRAEALARCLLANVLHLTSRPQEAIRVLEGQAERLPEWAERALLLETLGRCIGPLGDVDRAIELKGQAVQIYRRLGWRRREAVGLANFAGDLVMYGRRDAAITHLEEARELMRRIGERAGEIVVLTNLAVQHLFDLAPELAEPLLLAADRLGTASALHMMLPVVSLNRATAALQRHAFDAALVLIDEGLARANALGDTRHAGLLHAWRAAVLAELGQDAEAELQEARGLMAGGDASAAELLRLLQAYVAAVGGEAVVVERGGPRAEMIGRMIEGRR
jgi:DNA-binding winged helix-turn-helix (wHTH) protein/predicted ATPase